METSSKPRPAINLSQANPAKYKEPSLVGLIAEFRFRRRTCEHQLCLIRGVAIAHRNSPIATSKAPNHLLTVVSNE